MIGLSPQQSEDHSRRIHRELVHAGATAYGLLKSESRYLPRIIHKDEHIIAVIYGQRHSSSAMMVATDHRIIYLDKKPMAVFMDEVTYDVVSGVEMDIHTFFATLTLHSAKANYTFKFVNLHCADKFVSFIEEQRVRKEKLREDKTSSVTETQIEPVTALASALPDTKLAGYYWLPTDEMPAEDQVEEENEEARLVRRP